MRNGYQPITIKTTAGPVSLARPKLGGSTETFASRLLALARRRATLAEALGAQAAPSVKLRSTRSPGRWRRLSAMVVL